MLKLKKKLQEYLDCDDLGEMNKYVGCYVDQNGKMFKFTQPVLLQSFVDKFDLTNCTFGVPMSENTVLMSAE